MHWSVRRTWTLWKWTKYSDEDHISAKKRVTDSCLWRAVFIYHHLPFLFIFSPVLLLHSRAGSYLSLEMGSAQLHLEYMFKVHVLIVDLWHCTWVITFWSINTKCIFFLLWINIHVAKTSGKKTTWKKNYSYTQFIACCEALCAQLGCCKALYKHILIEVLKSN